MNEIKKYILIQNDGEIETNSFELIGASTKRDEKGKIGFFGSGLKYSIAYMMRKGIKFKIFSGLNELKFTTTNEKLKGKDFERICINGKETSYTVTMGPTWTKDWFVLREIYCNAIDEGTCTLVKEICDVNPSIGKTRIYIELTQELQNIVASWNAYFADERTPLFITEEIYTGYVSGEDGGIYNQRVSVYPKTNGILYRSGIRVWNNDKYLYDYNLDNVAINEDRTAKHAMGMGYVSLGIFSFFSDEGYIKSVLRSGINEVPCYEYQSLYTTDRENDISDKWIQFSQENLLVIKEKSGKFTEHLSMAKKEVFLIPAMFGRLLKQSHPSIKIIGMDALIGDVAFSEIEMTPKMSYLLKQVREALKGMKYEAPFDISAAEFENEKIMGHADIENKKIRIAASTFDMGRREIAMTIMEETEHIRSKANDETRKFETHIFSQWLKSMEEANGLFL